MESHVSEPCKELSLCSTLGSLAKDTRIGLVLVKNSIKWSEFSWGLRVPFVSPPKKHWFGRETNVEFTAGMWDASSFFFFLSITPSSAMPSGTVVNTTWWATCFESWPAGPLSATCGTCLPWPERYGLDNVQSLIYSIRRQKSLCLELWVFPFLPSCLSSFLAMNCFLMLYLVL